MKLNIYIAHRNYAYFPIKYLDKKIFFVETVI